METDLINLNPSLCNVYSYLADQPDTAIEDRLSLMKSRPDRYQCLNIYSSNKSNSLLFISSHGLMSQYKYNFLIRL